jgi:tRNA-dihydrouridine synthase
MSKVSVGSSKQEAPSFRVGEEVTDLNAEKEDCDLMFVLTAVIHKEEEMYKAVANLKEASELYLEEFPLEGELKRAFVTIFEVPQVAKTLGRSLEKIQSRFSATTSDSIYPVAPEATFGSQR